MVLVYENIAFYLLAPRVGYFAHMDLKQKLNVFFNQCQLAVLPLMSVFWASFIQNLTYMAKINVVLKSKSSLGSYQPNL